MQPSGPSTQALRISVSGLRGTGLVLQNNGGDDLAVSADGTISFATRLPIGTTYQVSLKSPPEYPPQTCTVSGDSGRVDEVTPPVVAVTCARPPHFAFVTSLSRTSVLSIDNASGAMSSTGFSIPYGGLLAATLAPNGRFLYWADLLTNSVRSFAINIDSGELRELSGSPAATGLSEPQAMAIAPSGKFLYVAHRASNQLSIFAVDRLSGTLTLSTETAATGNYPMAVAITPDGRHLYVANYTAGSISTYSLNSLTGAATFVHEISLASRARFLAVEAASRFLYMTSGQDNLVYALAIDGATGTLTSVPGSPFAAGNGAQNLATDPEGKALYVTNETDGTVSAFGIDATTGSLTSLGAALPAGQYPEGVAVDPSGAHVYVAKQANQEIGIYARDSQSGALSNPRASTTPYLPFGIAILGYR